MRVLIQRVAAASVEVEGAIVGSIGPGLLALVGVAEGDTVDDVVALGDKVLGLRIFSDEAGKMNLSIRDVSGEILVVSQFTLLADVSRGRRPSFAAAAPPDLARRLVDEFADYFASRGVNTAKGVFGAKMSVSLVNDGPVTLMLESSLFAAGS